MKHLKHIDSQSGFTLIEVLIASVIFSIGILALFSMQITSIKGNAHANALTVSANEARDHIEQFLNQDYNASDFDVGEHTSTGEAPITGVTWTVVDWISDDIDNDGDGKTDEFDERGVKNIEVVINYTSMGKSKSTSIQFFKTEIF